MENYCTYRANGEYTCPMKPLNTQNNDAVIEHFKRSKSYAKDLAAAATVVKCATCSCDTSPVPSCPKKKTAKCMCDSSCQSSYKCV